MRENSETLVLYFDFPGRAESIRLALAIAGIPFEDRRISFQEWARIKPTTPFGSVPVVKIDGLEIGQSLAALVYIGRKTGLYPTSDPIESVQVDQFLLFTDDLISASVLTVNEKDPIRKGDMEIKYRDDTLARYLTLVESTLAKNGSGYLYGFTLTVADLLLNGIMAQLTLYIKKKAISNLSLDILRQYPKLQAHSSMIQNIPQVKAFYGKKENPN